ncbi:MAG: alpha/beta hydrolase [Pseudomonadota bacterium]
MPRVFMLHAITRDRHDFADLAGRLEGAEALPLDHIGHGDAPRGPLYRVPDYATAIAPSMAQGDVIFGHSLGGLVALYLAGKRPGFLRAVVLEDPPLFDSRMPRMADSPYLKGFAALKALMGRHPDYGEADWARRVAEWPSGHGDLTIKQAMGDDGVARRAMQIAKFDRKALDAPMDGTLNDGFDVFNAIRSCQCPVHILAGVEAQGSALSPADLTLLALERNVTVTSIASEGHYIHEMCPDVCLAALRPALS